ncbi:hypothetical protein LTR09_003058 [Extremus antarcticus]|uniref:Uncharacterized protein n=1 Tax=Extremus antarcticus TaxID=702011 RepID=A0AAJ0GE79_9PEZI|nr:hypothetical protein LTR09_003058 [Extremus antarcticus]
MPPKEEIPVVADENDDTYASKNDDAGNTKPRGKTSNPNQNVGGTAHIADASLWCSKDGGLSTADTVADGGPDDEEKDSSSKPS